jgi:hypothetical protein
VVFEAVVVVPPAATVVCTSVVELFLYLVVVGNS